MAADQLSTTFAALADPTRRAILSRLTAGEASVTELAGPFDMSLPAVTKHLKVLQRAGLISQGREAQWRPCKLEARPMREAVKWMEPYRPHWENGLIASMNICGKPRRPRARVGAAPERVNEMSSHARSIKHGSFSIERYFNYDIATLYRAWTDPAAKARWFNGPADKWTEVLREMDVRVGGRERAIGKFADGSESRFEAIYFDVVSDRRLVYTYDMYWQGKKISVSLASVEFVVQGKDGSRGAKLIVTEQHAFLDGYEDAGNRERGTQGLMDNLEVALAGGDTRVPRKA